NNDSNQQGSEKFDTVKATVDKPTAIGLQPQLAPGQHTAQAAVNGCQPYTVTVNPNVKFPVIINAVQSLGQASSAPAGALSPCNVPGGSVITVNNPAPTSSGGFPIITTPTWTQTMTITGDTNQDSAYPGQLIFGIKSNHAGSVSIQAGTRLANTAN